MSSREKTSRVESRRESHLRPEKDLPAVSRSPLFPSRHTALQLAARVASICSSSRRKLVLDAELRLRSAMGQPDVLDTMVNWAGADVADVSVRSLCAS